MDWLNTFSNLIIQWLPWITFFNESWFLQFLLIYTLYNIFFNTNLFYVLFYLLFQIFLFGIFLSLYQMDLFTAFLWLAESVVIFISILVLFYLNVYGNINKINRQFYSYKYFGLLIFFFLLNHFWVFPSEIEFFLPVEFNVIDLWDDYYEALSNEIMNDLYGLFVSYYYLNSFEFIFIGLILLIGSVICVNLNRITKINKINAYSDLFIIFDFFKDFAKFIFMRKQNLTDQENHPASTRIFKKKIN